MVLPDMHSQVLTWQESLALRVRHSAQSSQSGGTHLLQETLLGLASLRELVKDILGEHHPALTAGATTVAAVYP